MLYALHAYYLPGRIADKISGPGMAEFVCDDVDVLSVARDNRRCGKCIDRILTLVSRIIHQIRNKKI